MALQATLSGTAQRLSIDQIRENPDFEYYHYLHVSIDVGLSAPHRPCV